MDIELTEQLNFLNSYISGWSKKQCIDKLKMELQKRNYTGIIQEGKIYGQEMRGEL